MAAERSTHLVGSDAGPAAVPGVHLAQINIGTMRAPSGDPSVAEFMANLDRINAQADAAPGFVWRLQTHAGNATDIQIFANPLELVNMSVWTSADALKAYVYRTEHADFFRRRAEWFERDAKRVALWWIRAGTVPTLADAVRRVEYLERHGPSSYAFGFARPQPPVVVDAEPEASGSADQGCEGPGGPSSSKATSST